ncbi:MAG TPA: hypothetical protein PLL57_12545 [Flavobacteriales bacterium]|nr:hypothetical protein [Flavobacteriales bacterium]
MHRTSLLAPALVLSCITAAQTPALDELNERFSPTVKFHADKHRRLVLDIHDQGERIRQDLMDPMDLDPQAITFSAEEDGLVLKCREDRAQCISKEIFKLDVVRLTSRVTIPKPAADPDGQATIGLLRGWLEAAQAEAERTVNGTPPGPLRKNGR